MRQPPFSPARALGQVFFLSSSISSSVPRHLSPLLLRNTATTTRSPLRHARILAASSAATTRTFATTSPLRKREYGRGLQKQRPANDAIPYKWVKVVQEDGSLSEPQRLERVLRRMDLETHRLEMVARPPAELKREAEREAKEKEGEGEGEGGEDVKKDTNAWDINDDDIEGEAAVCKIIDKEAARLAEEEVRKQARARAVSTKELELNWAIAAHDLEHKMRRMREFLGKGFTVEIILAKKRRGRPALREEAQAVFDAVHAAVEQVPGARQTKRMEGEVGGVVKLVFEGPSKKKRDELEAQEKDRLARKGGDEAAEEDS